MLYIVVKKKGILVKVFPFDKEEILIGRESSCDVILMDPLVSRKHCVLKKEGEEIFIKDENSKNGTFLNYKKIISAKFQKGDKIGIGNFEIEIIEGDEIPDEMTKEIKSIWFDKKEEIEFYIYRDPLTGLYSRKFFEDEIKKWGKEVLPLSILFIDIDDFKKFNDNYGHKKGDLVLKSLGDFLLKKLPNDFSLRWGGEEFLIFLKNKGIMKAKEVAENLREEFLKWIIEKIGIKITISIGISEIPGNAISIEEGIEKADRAMYRAKFEGKNRVIFYENK